MTKKKRLIALIALGAVAVVLIAALLIVVFSGPSDSGSSYNADGDSAVTESDTAAAEIQDIARSSLASYAVNTLQKPGGTRFTPDSAAQNVGYFGVIVEDMNGDDVPEMAACKIINATTLDGASDKLANIEIDLFAYDQNKHKVVMMNDEQTVLSDQYSLFENRVICCTYENNEIRFYIRTMLDGAHRAFLEQYTAFRIDGEKLVKTVDYISQEFSGGSDYQEKISGTVYSKKDQLITAVKNYGFQVESHTHSDLPLGGQAGDPPDHSNGHLYVEYMVRNGSVREGYLFDNRNNLKKTMQKVIVPTTKAVPTTVASTFKKTTTTAAPTTKATTTAATTTTRSGSGNAGSRSDLKVGFIFLHDENSTYDKNFIDAVRRTKSALGLDDSQILLKTNVPEGSECYDAAAELVDAGCDVIFADSFGHEPFMLQAAQEFPGVQFYQAAGCRAHTERLSNFHNAYAAIHDGRFLTGVAAGMKLNEMIDSGEITAGQAKLGFVGAFPYAEVISAYTAFFLGARYVCPAVTMEVRYTNSWYDESLEKEAANALIRSGCVLISQYTDSMGAPAACEAAGVPNVSYNGSTISAGADTYLISSRIDWKSCFESIINAAVSGTALPADWVGTLADGSVVLESLNTSVAASGTQKKLDEVRKKLINGSLHVFDTSTFTVNGAKLTSYKADVDYDSSFTPDTEAVSDGYFHESEYRSAPYFDIIIDGITVR